MAKKIIGVLLILIPFYASSQTKIDTSLSFFPNQVGDQWIYYRDLGYMRDSLKVEVKDIVSMPNGKSYRLFTTTNLASGQVDSVYKRVDSTVAVVWQYDPRLDIDIFPDSLLSTNSYPYYYQWIQGKVLGTIRTIRKSFMTDNARYWASGIGLYYLYEGDYGVAGLRETLIYAKIGGTEYTSVPKVNIIPSSFNLGQPYPNPFNPVSYFTLTVNSKMHVRVEVVNSLGQMISVLADRVFSSGYYPFLWNANSFASGVYYIIASGNDNLQVQRLVLMK